MATNNPKLDSQTISEITQKEKELTGSVNPAAGGPTAQAQKHAGEPLDSDTISAITAGEKNVTGGDRVKGGPTATAQSILTKSNQQSSSGTSNETSSAADGVLYGETIANVTAAESRITGDPHPVAGGPTAQAQKHTGQPLSAQVLRDVTEGEKKITGQDRPVAGGPTAQVQHDLTKSRQ